MSGSGRDPGTFEAPRSSTREEIFQLARSHPLYRERLAAVGSAAECPITVKEDVRAWIDAARRSREPSLDAVYWSPSGGSTSRGKFYWPTDLAENRFARARFGAVLKAASFFSGVRCLLNM